MDPREITGLAGLGVLLLLILLRIPVVVAMIAVGLGGSYALSVVAPFLRFEPYLRQFKSMLWESMASYDLTIIPLFVLMGYVAGFSGLSRDLFDGIQAMIGRMRGGLAISAIVACAGFGAVCGSSAATASAMGRIALPELKKGGYAPGFSAGVLAAGGTLGILIPPSVALVIYGVIVEASILDLFRAAILPGLIAVVFFVAVIALYTRLRPEAAPVIPPMPGPERLRALLRFLPVAGIFGALIFGLAFGIFTPTPAAAIGALAVILYGAARRLITGDGLTWNGLREAVLSTAVTSGMIYAILFGAAVLTSFFTRSGLPMGLADWAATARIDPYLMLVICLGCLIVMGCFLESLSMILVIVPFLWPVMLAVNGGEYVSADQAAFGLGPDELKIWFGILMLIVIELGLITPPVGMNVFIIGAITPSTPMGSIFAGASMFFAAEVVRVALLILFPAILFVLI